MNHYPHHIGDFNSASRHLAFAERALYRDLIEVYYDTEKPIAEAEFELVCRKILANTPEIKASVRQILNEFFELREGLYYHHRCEEEIQKYRDKVSKAVTAGRIGGSRRSKRKSSVRLTDDKQTLGESLAIRRTTEPQNRRTTEPSNTPFDPSDSKADKETLVLQRIRKLFGMRESTPLDKASLNAWKSGKEIAMEATDEEWEILEWHHSQPIGFQKRSISALLNDWGKALQTARNTLAELNKTSKPAHQSKYADAF